MIFYVLPALWAIIIGVKLLCWLIRGLSSLTEELLRKGAIAYDIAQQEKADRIAMRLHELNQNKGN